MATFRTVRARVRTHVLELTGLSHIVVKREVRAHAGWGYLPNRNWRGSSRTTGRGLVENHS